MTVHSPLLLAVGIAIFSLGIVLWRWASRHSIDVRGAALSSAFTAARSRQMPALPHELKSKLDAVAAEPSHVGKVKAVGGSVARHFLAKVATMASVAAFLGGGVVIASALLGK